MGSLGRLLISMALHAPEGSAKCDHGHRRDEGLARREDIPLGRRICTL
jgi:hypothetical protein